MDIFKLVGRIVIKNEEANQAIDDTTKKAEGLGGALDGAGTSADNASSKMGESSKFNAAAVWMGNAIYKVTEKAIELGTNLAKIGFNFDASIEAYGAQFKSMLGDEEQAMKLLEDIKNLAKDTPLGMEGLVVNATSLMSHVPVDQMIDRLTMLGNIARGSQTVMNSVTKAYRDVMGKNKLMAQELYQFTEAGVNVIGLLTKYGGEAYADGSWYSAMVSNPKENFVPFEDLHNAFVNATSEGGQFFGYMDTMMTTWEGQVDRFQEGGKETLGAFMQSFFDEAKENVLPRMSESLEKFGTWVENNKETLGKIADATGQMVSGGFDKVLEFLQWMIDNGEKAKGVFAGIATAMYLGAISAHPYATAIATIVAGLAALTAHENKVKGGDILAQYSNEELANLQAYVEAMRELKEAEKAWDGDWGEDATNRLFAAQDAADAAEAAVNKTKGLMDDYYAYLKMNGVGKGEDIWIDVPAKISEDSESNMQGDLNSMTFESYVEMIPEMTRMYNLPTVTAYANVVPIGSGSATNRWFNSVIPGHASGLDDVPYDNYIARLHKGEAVLNSTNAEAWRSGGMNTGRLEGMMAQLISLTQQLVSSSGKQVVLDSGVLVGQLAPALDTQLGTISSRKGRRN